VQKPYIVISNVSKVYKDFSLEGINISANKGEYFVLLGHSGAGKSMLFEILAGLKSPSSGSVTLNDRDITDLKINERKVGIVFQDYAIFPHKKVRDNIAFPMKSKFTKKEILERTHKLAEQLSISHLLNKFPHELSGGETQRCVLARTLASEPDILLLDEPLAALDVQLKSEIREILKEINKQGLTIIHITHYYREAISLADRIAIIDNGKIVQQGKPSEIFTSPKTKFTAAFAGISNFYEASIPNSQLLKTKLVHISESDIKLWASTQYAKTTGFALVKNEDIILSLEKQESSSRNNLKGTITHIVIAPNGIEVTINAGIIVTSLITEKSSQRLNLEIGKEIWASFKASSVKFIRIAKSRLYSQLN